MALGGNALLNKGETPTFETQLKNATRTAKHLLGTLANRDKRIVITHGNGPQVGNEYLRSEYASREVPRLPLYIMNAETQALIGSILELAFMKELERIGINRKVTTVVTHVVVNGRDSAFRKPTKPVGPFYTKNQLKRELANERFSYAKFGAKYRRIVPSPKPISIVELNEIKTLMHEGYIVLCCGGGGVPVSKEGSSLKGSNAVIDKDATTRLLANSIGATEMVILTNVDKLYLDYPKMKQPVSRMAASELERKINRFEAGTMRPKLEACVEFVRKSRKIAKIGDLFDADRVVHGKAGTIIY